MNSKQSTTLKNIFANPTKSNISWQDIEKLMISLDAKIRGGKGSAGVFIFLNKVFPFQKPHPQKKAKRYQVEALRKFLIEQGVKYEK